MYSLHCTLFKFCAAVDSMWVKRVSGQNVNAAIALRKVVGMGYKFVGGFTWSWVVQYGGVTGLYAACAALYAPVLLGLARLPEPPAPPPATKG